MKPGDKRGEWRNKNAKKKAKTFGEPWKTQPISSTLDFVVVITNKPQKQKSFVVGAEMGKRVVLCVNALAGFTDADIKSLLKARNQLAQKDGKKKKRATP